MKHKILSYLIDNGDSPISAMSKSLDYCIPTITKYLELLRDQGYVKVVGTGSSQRGRKAAIWSICDDGPRFLGVDVKQFSIQFCLISLSGKPILEKEYKDFRFDNTPAVFEQFCSTISSFIDSVEGLRQHLVMTCVTIGGRVSSATGESFSIFKFEENGDTPLSTLFSSRIGNPVMIQNDTQAMTYGEWQHCRRNEQNMIFLNVSWGLGMGLIIGGKPYSGANGYAGEIGHINAYPNERICHCGKKGCLETEISISAIVHTLEENILKGKSSLLSPILHEKHNLTVEDLHRAIEEEDPLAIETVEACGSELGRWVANLINIFNPQSVIIGGELTNAGNYFLMPIEVAMRKYALKLIARDVTVAHSCLGGKCGAIGAALLARDREMAI